VDEDTRPADVDTRHAPAPGEVTSLVQPEEEIHMYIGLGTLILIIILLIILF
jgi:hypothetical protein